MKSKAPKTRKKRKTMCRKCGRELEKDWIALNKKLLGRKLQEFLCLSCLAQSLDCTEEDLEDIIEQCKEDGCNLF